MPSLGNSGMCVGLKLGTGPSGMVIHGILGAAERRFGMLSYADTNASDAFQVAGPEACVEPASRRNKNGQILCRHNRRLYHCVDCGGAGICAHKREER
jgi:hypothetical protein